MIPFKKYLYENHNKNTAKTYYSAVVKLFNDIQFNSLKQIEPDWLLEEAKKKFKTSSEFSAAKNGLKELHNFNSDLRIPSEDDFINVSSTKRRRSKKRKKVIYLKPTQRKINQIKNDKLRYAYRLAMVSGLRVSELADLESSDIEIREDKIFVTVRNGKGGHGGTIECMYDEYLLTKLPSYLEKHPEGKLFYSEVYMRECADQLGIECHDLRRIFAIQTRNQLKKDMPVSDANDIVQQRLRHARFSTTKRYLFNRKLRFQYEKEEPKVTQRMEDIDTESGEKNNGEKISETSK